MKSRRLSENGYFPQSLRQAQIIVLEILPRIPVVIIFTFLDLEKILILGQPPSSIAWELPFSPLSKYSVISG